MITLNLFRFSFSVLNIISRKENWVRWLKKDTFTCKILCSFRLVLVAVPLILVRVNEIPKSGI